ncbi:MAG: PEP-CTERM sorting domain-containing protein [Candidatus Omnitrophica bacterium]|nr:PEP-CTERM sorting domain-containing protein [Candidatus Omnitrophota bacterium]
MKKLMLALILGGLVLSVPHRAEAVFIVDTGTPTGDTPWSAFNASTVTGHFQFLAGQFTTTNDYVINSLEGYFATATFIEAGPLDAVLYLDNAGSLDMVGELFRQTFSIPQTTDPDQVWTGVYGINHNLLAGTYWLAFEAQDGASSTTMRNGAPSPLDAYAFYDDTGSGYANYPLDMGIRIDASRTPGSTAVPEPMTMLMFGTGLAGAAWRRKYIG